MGRCDLQHEFRRRCSFGRDAGLSQLFNLHGVFLDRRWHTLGRDGDGLAKRICILVFATHVPMMTGAVSFHRSPHVDKCAPPANQHFEGGREDASGCSTSRRKEGEGPQVEMLLQGTRGMPFSQECTYLDSKWSIREVPSGEFKNWIV